MQLRFGTFSLIRAADGEQTRKVERQVTATEKPDERETEAPQNSVNLEEALESLLRSRISGAEQNQEEDRDKIVRHPMSNIIFLLQSYYCNGSNQTLINFCAPPHISDRQT